MNDWFDELLDRPGLLIVLIISVLIGLFLVYAYWGAKHPCLKYGPPYQQTMYVKIGDILVPKTSTVQDCLIRAGYEK